MFEARYIIMCRTTSGEIFEAFRWTRGAEAGIARALREARAFGRDVKTAWAIPTRPQYFRLVGRPTLTFAVSHIFLSAGSIPSYVGRTLDNARETVARIADTIPAIA